MEDVRALFVSLFTHSFGFARLFAALVASSPHLALLNTLFVHLYLSHPFRFSSPAAFATLACSLFTDERLGRTTKHPQGLLWRASSNIFHSFDPPFVLKQEHALSSIASAPYSILSLSRRTLTCETLGTSKSNLLHRTERQALGMNCVSALGYAA